MKTEKFNCIPFIIENTWLMGMDRGWGNGYVAIPENHPLFGKDYNDKIKCDLSKVKFNGNYVGLFCGSLEKDDKSEMSIDMVIDVHCGITYSDEYDKLRMSNAEPIEKELPTGKYWVFGFDTAHFEDTSENWPKEKVIEETMKLKEQLESFSITV